ncbi:hypothetical protein [Ferrimonas marina]|uniref:DUF1579 domain-containing protein n=1 Tax=Ferrimonas marina TaxID=299255 RepID=A0A1M5Z481_9GAMM|nr:hypothetical protein [Ferrimonas marina]SHI19067.1 hypothetical protein SAMN02745129_4622 [Ferrimonas marina]
MRAMVLLWLCSFSLSAELAPAFEPLAPMVGKTWRGEFSNSTPERPMVDISTWEEALQGQAVRIRHSLNQGEYEGETFIVYNKALEELEFFYFTTAGFYTRGQVTFEGDTMISHETVTGSEQGITEVKAEVRLLPDGSMAHQAYYLQNGEWVKGHAAEYRAIEP